MRDSLDISKLVFEPLNTHPLFQNLTGNVYGRWTVLGYAGRYRSARNWYCMCECGFVDDVRGGSLTTGNSQSCGCLKSDNTRGRMTTHGMCGTPEYYAYIHAKSRCENLTDTRFHTYGGRGIKFLFKDFDDFFACLGYRTSDEHSLDRIDNDGDYTCGNCRWSTQKEQANNRTSNKILHHNDMSGTVSWWSDLTGLSYSTIQSRLNYGWSIEDALTTPV